jgi:hypothetical protein
MCFNEKTSLLAGGAGLTSAIYLLLRNRPGGEDLSTGLLILVVCVIQFIEWKLWQDTTCSNKNKKYSKILMWTIILQPVVYTLLTYINRRHFGISKNNFATVGLIALVYTMIGLYSIYSIHKSDITNCTQTKCGHCRLSWGFMEILHKIKPLFYYLLAIGYIVVFASSPLSYSLFRTRILQGILLASIALSWHYDKLHVASIWGSLWCFLSVFYGIIYILFT